MSLFLYGLHIGFFKISIVDFIDVALVSLALFQLYKILRGSIALRIFFGVLFVYAIYLLVGIFDMQLLQSILGQFFGVGVIATIIIFQQEIRKFLLLLGKTTPFSDGFFKFGSHTTSAKEQLDLTPIVEAAKILSSTKTGALIVFARNSELKFYADSGDILDSAISKRLIIAIFQKYSPLHDGAVIVAHKRIRAARCILPVSESDEIPAHMGLRHRSAIGLTEVTDAVVLVVSEETGNISIAQNGQIEAMQSKSDLKKALKKWLYPEEASETAVLA
jgi:diadenylate cyclase